MTREIKRLLNKKVLVLTEDFNMCDICSKIVDTVITNEELWDKWQSSIQGNLIVNYNLILI